MLKIGQNWGKIANYPPQRSTKIGTTDFWAGDGPGCVVFKRPAFSSAPGPANP